jgi:enamine deaminase RidA (YjgF/YER057c/UK114 family)
LPEPPPSRAECPPYRQVGEAIHIAGQLPFLNGEGPAQGQLGGDVKLSEAQDLARLTALHVLAIAASALGDLDRVRMVQMLAFVASTPDSPDSGRQEAHSLAL